MKVHNWKGVWEEAGLLLPMREVPGNFYKPICNFLECITQLDFLVDKEILVVLGRTENSVEELGLGEAAVRHLHERDGWHGHAHSALLLEPSAFWQGVQTPPLHSAPHGPEQEGSLVGVKGREQQWESKLAHGHFGDEFLLEEAV